MNQSRLRTAVICIVTSNLNLGRIPGNVALKQGEGGLTRASVVNVSQLLTVDKAELTEKIGKLHAERVDAIRRGITRLIDRV